MYSTSVYTLCKLKQQAGGYLHVLVLLKKVLINYKDIEILSGLTINADVNLKNIMSNVEGIKNIEKIM